MEAEPALPTLSRKLFEPETLLGAKMPVCGRACKALGPGLAVRRHRPS
jgi:hypothetical protein